MDKYALDEIETAKQCQKCLLCVDAPCLASCPHNVPVEKILRSLRFQNEAGACARASASCLNCSAPCEAACIAKEKIAIRDTLLACLEKKAEHQASIEDVDLSTDFCGFALENPFLLSSSVVASTYEMCKRAFDMGWAGAAFKSISCIDIHEASPRFSALKEEGGNFLGFKNIEQLSDRTPEENFAIIRRLKSEYPSKFLLVSILGRNDEEWRDLALGAEASGADAVELNFSCPNMTKKDTGSDIGQIPEFVERYTRIVKEAVKIPVIAKLTPNVMKMSPAAEAAKRGGADGIAAINTIKSMTDENILHAIEHKTKIAIGGLSGASVRPIALRFIAELAQNKNLADMHITAMGGIYTCLDAVSFLALGASSLQATTSVMEYGYRIIFDLLEGLKYFLIEHGMHSLDELRGIALPYLVDIEKIERDHVILPRFIRSRCVGCGRCYLSCRDGGHQAIEFHSHKPTLLPFQCVGCHLCVLVCPCGAIESSEKSIPLSELRRKK